MSLPSFQPFSLSCFFAPATPARPAPVVKPAVDDGLAALVATAAGALTTGALATGGNPWAPVIGIEVGEGVFDWLHSLVTVEETPQPEGQPGFDLAIDWTCATFEAECPPADTPRARIGDMFKQVFGYEMTEPAFKFYEGQLKLYNGDEDTLRQYMIGYRDDLKAKGVF